MSSIVKAWCDFMVYLLTCMLAVLLIGITVLGPFVLVYVFMPSATTLTLIVVGVIEFLALTVLIAYLTASDRKRMEQT